MTIAASHLGRRRPPAGPARKSRISATIRNWDALHRRTGTRSRIFAVSGPLQRPFSGTATDDRPKIKLWDHHRPLRGRNPRETAISVPIYPPKSRQIPAPLSRYNYWPVTRIFDRLIERFDLVQLPVLPLIDPKSRWIAGHYSDEFAEAHGKELVVREAMGAALPSAGVGCAFARDALGRIAMANGGFPFASESLTEDYELGLRLREVGGRAAFVRLSAGLGRPVVVTREYFPTTIETAVRQKSRWMTGIALTGWDRLGWSGGLAERWMRLRDRQSVLAAALLFAGYVALLLWAMRGAFSLAGAKPPPSLSTEMEAILLANLGLLIWRLAMRCAFVSHAYGWREGARSILRVAVGNAIAMLAARSAIASYLAIRRTGEARWDKTAHVFPEESPAE